MPSKQKHTRTVQLSQKEYDRLRSRPKQNTLARDTRQGHIRKGKRGSPYLQTLLDPQHVTGVKVPDVTSFPSSTFQLYERYEVTVGANPFAVAYTPLPASYRQLNANMNGANNWGAWTAHGDQTALNALYHSLRPVSAMLKVYTSASSSSNQGELTAALLPKSQSLNALLTVNAVANRFGAFRAPLKIGAELLWMPQDPDSRSYSVTSTAASSATMSTSWPGWVVGVEGAAVNTIVIFESYINYEAVPEDATFNLVSASAPYISSRDAEEATGFMAKMGTFARPYGEDLGAWLLDQGAVVAGQLGGILATGAVHYVADRVSSGGLRSQAMRY